MKKVDYRIDLCGRCFLSTVLKILALCTLCYDSIFLRVCAFRPVPVIAFVSYMDLRMLYARTVLVFFFVYEKMFWSSLISFTICDRKKLIFLISDGILLLTSDNFPDLQFLTVYFVSFCTIIKFCALLRYVHSLHCIESYVLFSRNRPTIDGVRVTLAQLYTLSG